MSFPTRLSTRTTSNTPLPYFCRPTRTRTSLNASEDSSVQTESTTSLQQRAFRWSIVKESLSLGMVLAPRMKRSRNNIKMSKVPDCSQAHPFTLFFFPNLLQKCILHHSKRSPYQILKRMSQTKYHLKKVKKLLLLNWMGSTEMAGLLEKQPTLEDWFIKTISKSSHRKVMFQSYR